MRVFDVVQDVEDRFQKRASKQNFFVLVSAILLLFLSPLLFVWELYSPFEAKLPHFLMLAIAVFGFGMSFQGLRDYKLNKRKIEELKKI